MQVVELPMLLLCIHDSHPLRYMGLYMLSFPVFSWSSHFLNPSIIRLTQLTLKLGTSVPFTVADGLETSKSGMDIRQSRVSLGLVCFHTNDAPNTSRLMLAPLVHLPDEIRRWQRVDLAGDRGWCSLSVDYRREES